MHHVSVIRAEASVASLQDLRDAVGAVEFPELDGARSFRVTAHVGPDSSFEREEAAGATGAALQRGHGTPVDLEDFAVHVRLDLQGERMILSRQLTEMSLGKRLRRARNLRVSLKPTVAAAMVRLAGAHRGEGSLLDPTCGVGTIPIEARSVNPLLAVHASDWDASTVEVARRTVLNHDLEIEVRHCDARSLRAGWDRRFGAIISNPPHGVRLARGVRLSSFYESLVASFLDALEEGGRLVVITPRRKAMDQALSGLPLRLVAEHVVEAGGLQPRISVLEAA